MKLAVYGIFAETGNAPTIGEVATRVGSTTREVGDAYRGLRARRVLVVGSDGESILMAPPFSGVPTQHRFTSDGVEYAANCAWDVLGVAAALGTPGTVRSRCEQSGEPLVLAVEEDGPNPCDWWFHCAVPAREWWDDIVFT